ncbi:hypothetical protein SAMN05444920_13253 [Nonomuraea solani]|uniref:Uncharacterized protein n=1 Tax=Nonomuraea solani TaxID=1144553 RepID=A0A1H6F270_9ACTN|nr:hypothetical protein [Nonomuraea solani]SEH03044.1 hypothetical protein SAMN05444920_13253 [Nonomuraea solani]
MDLMDNRLSLELNGVHVESLKEFGGVVLDPEKGVAEEGAGGELIIGKLPGVKVGGSLTIVSGGTEQSAEVASWLGNSANAPWGTDARDVALVVTSPLNLTLGRIDLAGAFPVYWDESAEERQITLVFQDIGVS